MGIGKIKIGKKKTQTGKRREEAAAGFISRGPQCWDELLHSWDGAATAGKSPSGHIPSRQWHVPSFHPAILQGLVDLEANSGEIGIAACPAPSREAPGQGAEWGKPACHAHGCF